LNKDAVRSWIAFCIHLVELADDVTHDVLHPFLRKHIEEMPEQYPLAEVLIKLGMPYLAKWYPREIVIPLRRPPPSLYFKSTS
jgi:hypothetical protein